MTNCGNERANVILIWNWVASVSNPSSIVECQGKRTARRNASQNQRRVAEAANQLQQLQQSNQTHCQPQRADLLLLLRVD